MGISGGPDIIQNGLIVEVDATDRNSYVSGSTTWTSLVGNYSGSLIQSCSFSSGPPQTFTNNITLVTQTAYLSMTPELQLFDQTNYTLDFWVKLRSGNISTLHSLVGRGSTNNWILLDVSANDGSAWQVKFRDLSFTYNNFSSVTDYNIASNWTNITLTADTSRNLSFYLNGAFRETIALTNSFMRITRIMGGYQSGGNGYNLQGSMSSTKFYDTILSATEIAQNYNALKSRFGIYT